MNKNQVLERFIEIYGESSGKIAEEISIYHSPGRINLIGEHTDYNGGFVFPCALSFGTFGVIRARNDGTLNFVSENFPLRVSCDIDSLVNDPAHDWANYPKGAVKQLIDRGLRDKITGADIFIAGNIPNGAGLSSSASVEILMLTMYNDLFSLGIDPIEIAKMGQKSENVFIGVNCGIMDQFIIAMGKKDNAVLLDCMKMEYSYVPAVLNGCKIVIANTNKRRELAGSKYNERRAECELAVENLKNSISINFLGDLTVEEFEQNAYLIGNETVRKRAKHVVYENARVLDAVASLKGNDIVKFGQLMNESHDSLRDLYEVTGVELDTLVDEARKVSGVLGSRMTGAGFGGCTVSLVEDSYVEKFIECVGKNYRDKTGLTADFYIADIGDGAKRLIERLTD